MSDHQHKMIRSLLRFLTVLVACVCSAAPFAEELVVSEHAIVNTGHHIYMRTCAVCHGTDGKGDGPYAPMLVAASMAMAVSIMLGM